MSKFPLKIIIDYELTSDELQWLIIIFSAVFIRFLRQPLECDLVESLSLKKKSFKRFNNLIVIVEFLQRYSTFRLLEILARDDQIKVKLRQFLFWLLLSLSQMYFECDSNVLNTNTTKRHERAAEDKKKPEEVSKVLKNVSWRLRQLVTQSQPFSLWNDNPPILARSLQEFFSFLSIFGYFPLALRVQQLFH